LSNAGSDLYPLCMNESVFISYSRQDAAVAEELHAFFSQLGLDVFRDVEGLNGGEDWRHRILDAAKRARAFVFLSSAASLSGRPMIEEELEIARAKLLVDGRFTFLTIRLDETDLRDWMLRIQFRRWQDEDLFTRLAATVNAMLDPASDAVTPLSRNVFLNTRPTAVEYETAACSYRYSVPSVAIVGDRHVADEVNALIRGRIAEVVLRMRGFTEGGPVEKNAMPSMIVVDLIDADVSEDNVGLSFEHFTYSSGAAHPTHDFVAINIGRSPWGLVEAHVLPADLPELSGLIADAVEAEGHEFLWERDVLVRSLQEFDYGRYTVFTATGVKLLFPDLAIGAHVNGPSILEVDDPDVLRLLRGYRN